MVGLTVEQLAFLEGQQVPLSRVLDATGLSTKVMKAQMRYFGHWVAFGTAPCGAFGHTMKLRSGHCFQCNPKNLVVPQAQRKLRRGLHRHLSQHRADEDRDDE